MQLRNKKKSEPGNVLGGEVLPGPDAGVHGLEFF